MMPGSGSSTGLTAHPAATIAAISRLVMPFGRYRAAACWSTPDRQLVEEPLGQRAPLRRKLVGGRAQVRPDLAAGVGEIADLPHAAQCLAVVIEQRRRE